MLTEAKTKKIKYKDICARLPGKRLLKLFLFTVQLHLKDRISSSSSSLGAHSPHRLQFFKVFRGELVLEQKKEKKKK